MKLNVNDKVRARLTDLGRKTLAVLRAKTNEDFAARFPNATLRLSLAVPEEDGWSWWQLWELMATFGEFCGNGMPLMFETEIEIQDPPGTLGWEPFSSDTVESAQAWAAGRWVPRQSRLAYRVGAWLDLRGPKDEGAVSRSRSSMAERILISTDTLAAIVALTSVGVGSECRGEQEAATITREATESILRRLGVDPAVFADKVRDAMARLHDAPETAPRGLN